MENAPCPRRPRRSALLSLIGALVLIGGISKLESADSFAPLTPVELRAEYREQPLSIDASAPRLSWTLQSTGRAQRQSAYQIQVAHSGESLVRGEGDRWDSGKVESDAMHQIAYDGTPLGSRDRCFWRVRVWDQDGHASRWSAPAEWSMGLLNPSDWQGKWIGYDEAREHYEAEDWDPLWLEGADWIWSAEPEQAAEAVRWFRLEFELPEGAQISETMLVVSSWQPYDIMINGKQNLHRRIDQRGSGRASYFHPTRDLQPGKNVLTIRVPGLNTKQPRGLVAKLRVALEEGERHELVTGARWKTATTVAPEITDISGSETAWSPVAVVASFGDGSVGDVLELPTLLPPPRYLRKEFALERPVERAIIYVTALGMHDVTINGRAITEDRFQPGWTEYAKTLLYTAYDVTELLRRGDNAIGVVLTDGWYAGHVGYGGRQGNGFRDHYGRNPKLLLQMHLTFEDGEETVICSDESWRASASGPTVHADFLQGEKYDARLEIPGWDKAGFAAGEEWDPVNTGEDYAGDLAAYPAEPVRVVKHIEPKGFTEPEPGVYLFDLGTNFAGVVRLQTSAPEGTEITLRFGERLNEDGTLYTRNLRSARAVDTYIAKGVGVEEWAPRYTFHGFQYVEVTGLFETPDHSTITGLEFTSQAPVAGDFSSSDPLANQLYANITQTQRSNFLDIPTDCPQRDERLGWLGDAQVYVRTATYNNDVAAFFTKWLDTVNDSQRTNGAYTVVSPDLAAGGSDGTAAWADAGIICPWTIARVYGDDEIVRTHYAKMVRYMEFLREDAGDDLLRPARGYGDWLSINADTPKDVLATAYFARDAALMGAMAEMIGQPDQANEWRTLFDRIRAAFVDAYIDPHNGRITGDTQTVYVLALKFDLLPQDLRSAAVEHLIEDIRSRDWHLSTGFIGTKDLMQVLTDNGHVDVAYRLFHRASFPSWNFSILNGATSIWERWDGWTPEKGFQDAHMNSFAHYSFGAVAEWMFKTIGGIDQFSRGFREIEIAPRPGGKLTWANVGYRSISGQIRSDWRIEGEAFILQVEIPANTVATVSIPSPEGARIMEGDVEASEAEGVEYRGWQDGYARFRVGSGSYRFEAPRVASATVSKTAL